MNLQLQDPEQYLIGSILKFGISALEQTTDLIKNPNFFQQHQHRLIYQKALDLYKRGDSCDLFPLVENTDEGELAAMGGRAYLVELRELVISESHIPLCCESITNTYLRQQLVLIFTNIAQFAQEKTADALELIALAERRLLELQGQAAMGGLVPIKEIIPNVLKRIQEYQDGTIQDKLIFSGFGDLDRAIGGFLGGQLIIVAGYTSSGKTQFAVQLCEHIAIRLQKAVGLFSLEMPAESITERALFSQSHLDFALRRKVGGLDQHDWMKITNAQNRMAESNLLISDSPAHSILEIRTQTKRAMGRYDLKTIFIDYLSLIRTDENFENRQAEVASVTRNVKRLARELKIPVFLLCQLSREHQKRSDKTPQLFDLRESGAIEQDADIVIFVHHDKTESRFIVAKNRDGARADIPMVFINGRWEQLGGERGVPTPKREEK